MNPGTFVAGGDDAGWTVRVQIVDQPVSAPPAPTWQRLWRVFYRASAVISCSLYALAGILVRCSLANPSECLSIRAAWLHRWCQVACRVLGIRVAVNGEIPRSGLLVCNHLSYLDIVVLSALRPCLFVAKRDVAAWPLFGWLAKAAGTIFVDRDRKVAATGTTVMMKAALQRGALLVLFPEGTSSDGSTVLPFKTSLLHTAIELDCPITTAAIGYKLERGSVADEVCYWRDMTLVPHLLNLFTKPEIDCALIVRPFAGRRTDRKQIARDLCDQITAMRS